MTIWVPTIEQQSGPKYRAIASALADDVQTGRLQPGDRLPTHRDLADVLGVTVGTVTRAYAEAQRRGLVSGQVGRGTFVAASSNQRLFTAIFEHATSRNLDLGLNTPIYSEDPDLAQALADMARRPGIQDLLHYQPSAGHDRHRGAGVEWIRWYGVETSAERVVITAGAQHAILAVVATLLKPGETLLVEELTYPGLKAAAELLGLRLEAVAMDPDGPCPDALAAACRKTGARVMYLMPTLQNPTTLTLSARRRMELVETARNHDLWLIEDDVHRLLYPDPPPPLAALAPERTVLIAGTSKMLAGGLRVAYVTGPDAVLARLARSVSATIWMAPPLMAELAARWIEDGTARLVLRRKQEEAARRQRLASAVLSPFRFRTHPRAYHLWLELPEPWRPERLVQEAARRGVSVIGAETFVVPPTPVPAAVRVSLSAAPSLEALAGGLQVLADLLGQAPLPPPMIV
jgi:DNA-binding transcriptional MocR family regulator